MTVSAYQCLCVVIIVSPSRNLPIVMRMCQRVSLAGHSNTSVTNKINYSKSVTSGASVRVLIKLNVNIRIKIQISSLHMMMQTIRRFNVCEAQNIKNLTFCIIQCKLKSAFQFLIKASLRVA